MKDVSDILDVLDAARIIITRKLPATKVQPWNGHSPQECQLLNALTGVMIATAALNKYEDLCL